MKILRVDGEDARGVPGDDPGLLLGLTVFETLRTYGRRPFRLAQHLDRLEASAHELDIPYPGRAAIEREILGALGDNVRIRYTLTGGGHRVLDVAPADESLIGAKRSVARLAWTPSPWLPGAVKHGSRAAWVIAAQRLGVDEVILVDPAGHMLEANRSNVFAVVDGVVKTPPLDGRFLAGVTRGALIEAAREAGIPVNEEPVLAAGPFDELYLSSTLKHLAPIVRLDDHPGPGGGPVGDALSAALRALIQRETSES